MSDNNILAAFTLNRTGEAPENYEVHGTIETLQIAEFVNDQGYVRPETDITLDNVEVLVNGMVTREFGEKWTGGRYDDYDIAERSVLTYLNGAYGKDFMVTDMSVSPELEEVKGKSIFTSSVPTEIGEIPKYYLPNTYSTAVGELLLATDRFLAYEGPEISVLMGTKQRNLETDIEAFFLDGISSELEDPNTKVLYVNESKIKALAEEHEMDINCNIENERPFNEEPAQQPAEDAWYNYGDVNFYEYGGVMVRKDTDLTDSYNFFLLQKDDQGNRYAYYGTVCDLHDFREQECLNTLVDERGYVSVDALIEDDPLFCVAELVQSYGYGPFEFSPKNCRWTGEYSMDMNEFKLNDQELVQFMSELDIPTQYIPDLEYEAVSRYGDVGIEDTLKSNDWEEIKDFAHEKLMSGHPVELIDNDNGSSVILQPDEYANKFNGEFPVDPRYPLEADYGDNEPVINSDDEECL